MPVTRQLKRRTAIRAALLFAATSLAACTGIAVPGVVGNGGPKIDPARPVPVALLVPSGSGQASDEALARGLENAARLAMADLRGAQIDLRVYPTAGQAQQAASQATRAVDEGARIILGPVYAGAATAAGLAVAGRGVNVLSFSNNTDIAGGNIYVLGNTFENTANRLVRYAVRRGKPAIMIVHGRDASEQKGRSAIASAIAANGGVNAGTSSFELSLNGIVQAVPGIARQAGASGADVLFFTSSTAGALDSLTQLLNENGLRSADVQFVGLTRWDIPPEAVAKPALQGGWFALPDPALAAQFESRYAATYGAPPHPIAGLAYDGMAAIGALVAAGNRDALTANALTQASGFAGVNGVFRLRRDGTNERGLAIAEIRDRQVNVIDPAPRSFGGAGF